jgi:hypothetical protein
MFILFTLFYSNGKVFEWFRPEYTREDAETKVRGMIQEGKQNQAFVLRFASQNPSVFVWSFKTPAKDTFSHVQITRSDKGESVIF